VPCPKCDWKPPKHDGYVVDGDKTVLLKSEREDLRPVDSWRDEVKKELEKKLAEDKMIVSEIEDRTGKLTLMYPILKKVKKNGKDNGIYKEHRRFDGSYRETMEINYCPVHGQYTSKRVIKTSDDKAENEKSLARFSLFVALCLLSAYVCIFSGLEIPSRIVWGSIIIAITVNYVIYTIDTIGLVLWIPGSFLCAITVFIWFVFDMVLIARIILGCIMIAVTVLHAVFGTIIRINWEQ
jgi:hypothetical protein